MAKVKLGARPKSFKKLIKFQMLDGTEGAIECEFKYRTRSEFAAFLDGRKKAAEGQPGDAAAAHDADGCTPVSLFTPASLSKQVESADSDNTDYILDILDGWNLDAELTRENVQELADTLPAAVHAIINTYRVAITEGRLGN